MKPCNRLTAILVSHDVHMSVQGKTDKYFQLDKSLTNVFSDPPLVTLIQLEHFMFVTHLQANCVVASVADEKQFLQAETCI